eukprot:TRINITY_DN33760_c0_g1_i1.p1 TRINITY_DN33760_c0_g1~~TRINITY_DN33760_c0_g1_i1.p1  ORF type:complete len:396 (+),score=13.80 TRINITY_DN33760_c0_g1_i1:172-1188(+)
MGEFGGGQVMGKGEDGSLETYKGHEGPVYGICFAPGAQRFVSGGKDKTIRLWNVETEEDQEMEATTPVVRTISHPGVVLAVDYSPTGNEIVSSSDDYNIYFFDAKTAKQSATLKGHTNKVYGVAFSPVGSTCPGEYVASCSLDKTVRLWSVEAQTPQGILKGHTDNVFGLNFSSGGRLLASGGDDKNIILWDWRNGSRAHVLSGHQTTIWSVAWSTDDRSMVSCSMGHEIKLWDLRMEKTRWSILDAHDSMPIHQAIFGHNDTMVLSGGRDRKLRVWDAQTSATVATNTGHTGTVYHLALHPSGTRLLSSSVDSTMKLWAFPPEPPISLEPSPSAVEM